MAWSCVGAQQGLGTVSGLIKWTWEESRRNSNVRWMLTNRCITKKGHAMNLRGEKKKTWKMSVVIPCHFPERQFTLKYNLQPFWIPEYSSFDSSHIVLTVDEMIRLLTWLFGFFVPRFHGYSQGFAQWHGLWRSCRSSEGRRTLPRNSTLRIPPARWSSPESRGRERRREV